LQILQKLFLVDFHCVFNAFAGLEKKKNSYIYLYLNKLTKTFASKKDSSHNGVAKLTASAMLNPQLNPE
jgi:hypothetical protein